MSGTYLIEADEGHVVEIFSSRFEDGLRISIHSNNRNPALGSNSTGYSELMARQICNGLLAILSGQFDRAVSETFLRLELEAETRAKQASANKPTPTISSTPTLESL